MNKSENLANPLKSGDGVHEYANYTRPFPFSCSSVTGAGLGTRLSIGLTHNPSVRNLKDAEKLLNNYRQCRELNSLSYDTVLWFCGCDLHVM